MDRKRKRSQQGKVNKGQFILIVGVLLSQFMMAQSTLTIYPDSLGQNIYNKYEYGTYYVPKTTEAQADFLSNEAHLNSIRLNIIELALNGSTDLSGTLAYLDNFSSALQEIAIKTDQLIFVFEKMPAWLSSSSDGSPAQTPGWFVLNTKPPSNYDVWNSMVQEVTNRIFITYGITNAHFEIWNEPDIGSWTGSPSEYFELFQATYDAIKGVNSSIPVGGPATNHWANNLTYIAPFGFISAESGELSLIANLIDSTQVWNKPLDFISWHNFNLTTETHQNAIGFIQNKCTDQGIQVPDLIISEWNAPSAVRDTDIHYSFAVKNTIAIKKSAVSNDAIAAWQDFSAQENEFHSGFGLLTYGSIRKPFFNAVWLAAKLKGIRVKSQSNVLLSHDASIMNDTLVLLLTNYAPPPVVEAVNHTLFEGQFSVLDLDNAGYVDIGTNDISVIESIYSGQMTIPNTTPIDQAINNSIPIYTYFDSIQSIIHTVEINLDGYDGDYSGHIYLLDDSTNNDQHVYNNLIGSGFTQEGAIAEIQGNQQVVSEAIGINNGSFQLELRPNSVVLLKIAIPNTGIPTKKWTKS